MAMSLGGGLGMRSEPNIVPLCDILLVLLIIFMVITPMFGDDIVQLPQAAYSADQPDAAAQLTVTIRRDGAVWLNERPVADRGVLKDRIVEELAGRADRAVYVKADSELEYAVIDDVLGMLRAAGVEKFGVVTEPLVEEHE